MIVDPQGNYYVQSGYRQSPRFTYSTDNPLQFTINKGKPIERNLTFYPVNMDKRVKAPLPVDKTLDVSKEYENAVNLLIKDNTTSITNKSTPINIYKFQRTNKYDNINGNPVIFYHADVPSYPISELTNKQNYSLFYTKPELYKTVNVPYDLNRIRKDNPDLAIDFERWIQQGAEDQSYHYDKPWFEQFEKYKTGTYINKPSRQEAEKKAVISISPLEKVKTFANGGHLFQKGGKVKGYKLSSKLMRLAQKFADKEAAKQNEEEGNGAPQSTFLMNRKN